MERPTAEELRAELARTERGWHSRRAMRHTIFTLVVVAAFAVLITTLATPVFRVYGDSMSPTLQNESIVVAVRKGRFQRGDVVAFYHHNQIMIKRVIALSGEWIDLDDAGVVSVNGEALKETYLEDVSRGDCSTQLPCQVPENHVFVMGDHRSVSMDSRSEVIGCVSEEEIIGKLLFCVWPWSDLGFIR